MMLCVIMLRQQMRDEQGRSLLLSRPVTVQVAF